MEFDPTKDALDLLDQYRGCFERRLVSDPDNLMQQGRLYEEYFVRVHAVVADLRSQYDSGGDSTKQLIERLSRAEAELAQAKYRHFAARKYTGLIKKARRKYRRKASHGSAEKPEVQQGA